MNLELVAALGELEKERGIPKEVLLEAIEAAVVSAYKRNYGTAQNVRVEVDDKGNIRVFSRKDVVEEVLEEANEISLEDAKAIDANYQLDDVVEIEVTRVISGASPLRPLSKWLSSASVRPSGP